MLLTKVLCTPAPKDKFLGTLQEEDRSTGIRDFLPLPRGDSLSPGQAAGHDIPDVTLAGDGDMQDVTLAYGGDMQDVTLAYDGDMQDVTLAYDGDMKDITLAYDCEI